MTKKALLIMAKRPQAGRTKTRLCPPLEPQQAADLYACFLQDIIDMVRGLDGITPAIAFAPIDEEPFFAELAPDFLLVPQKGETLGDRLDFVLSHLLNAGFEQVAAINSDSPTLPADYLQQSFTLLNHAKTDAVFGPCEDGGYYLIGVKKAPGALVKAVEMSTPMVLADTLKIADELGLAAELLPSWYDVDSAEELQRCQTELMTQEPTTHTAFFLTNFALE